MDVDQLRERLARAEKIVHELHEELAQTSHSLLALMTEMEQLLNTSKEELHAAHTELAKTNSELMQLTLEMDDIVRERTVELSQANEALRNEMLEHKRAEEALRGSEQRFRTMANSIPQLAWMAHADGYVFWYNRRWYEYTGTTPEQMEGWGWQSVHDPATLPTVLDKWRASIATGQPFEMEFPLRGADDCMRQFLTRVIPLRDSEGKVIQWFGTGTDITERKRAEEALKAARQVALDANSAKDQFLAVLSHELRTPLTPALMTISAHEADDALTPKLRTDLAMVRHNLELEARLIDDLLDFNRLARGKITLRPEPTDLFRAIRNVATICRAEIQDKGLAFHLELTAANHNVNGDGGRLQQVFWNLLKNATKFTASGGTITIRSFNPSDGTVRVEVADTGMGVRRESIPLLFVAFQQCEVRVPRQFGGLGLGLALSKAIVDLHGGKIWVESEGDGKGATFIVELHTTTDQISEISETGAEPMRRATKWRPKIGDRSLRILLVEDNADTLRIISRLLEKAGCHVTTAPTVSSALAAAEAARAGSETFDLVVSDLGLPDGDGQDLMRQLRERDSLRGIAISGYGMEEDIEKSRAAGFVEHLIKPIQIEELQAAISRLTSEA